MEFLFHSSPRRVDDSDDISWWKDSQLKSLGVAVVQRIHVGEGRKFRLILTRNEARLCYRSDGGGERQQFDDFSIFPFNEYPWARSRSTRPSFLKEEELLRG